MEEFELIERFLAPLASKEALKLKDDAAFLSPINQVWTTDNCVEGIHFYPEDNPALIAKKLLRRNISDLLAMGAVPKFYSLNLFLTEEEFRNEAWLKSFTEGLKSDQELFNIHLIGGDTTLVKGGRLSFSVSAIGEIKEKGPTLRSGAQIGDDIWVTGVIGLARYGLFIREAVYKGEGDLQGANTLEGKAALNESMCPTIPFGLNLNNIATASMDISDGFIQDISKMADLAHVQFRLVWEKIPKPSNFLGLSQKKFKTSVLAGGDDYQLIFTAAVDSRDSIHQIARELDISVTCIGKVSEGNGVILLENQEPIDIKEYAKGWRYSL